MIEAYDAPGAIALGQIFSFDKLQNLLSFTARLRQDPEIAEREEHEEWIDTHLGSEFVLTNDDGTEQSLTIEGFLNGY